MSKSQAMFRVLASSGLLFSLSLADACSGSDSTVGGGSEGQGNSGGSTFILPTGNTSGTAGVPGGGGASGSSTATWPPTGFINVTNASYGAYALGPKLSSLGGSSGNQGGAAGTQGACAGLFGVVRDFKMSNQGGTNPDFEQPPVDDKGIVLDTLGPDEKPVYGDHPDGTATTHGKNYFDEWYRDVDGVNMSYVVGLHFVQNGSVFTFAATIGNKGGVPNVSYFPLDGQGFGNQEQTHNYSFTTEFHTAFVYNGGETFTFQGDDDVWVFINNKLAIDLGGIHVQETQTVNLDQEASKLGITKGKTYSLAVFNAERHVTQSNFRIDTTMVFTDCGQIPGGPIF